MDSDSDEELSYSEESDDELDNGSNEPWQFGLTDIQERTMALFKNCSFTDITITFPGSDTTLDVHRLILSISSPVFEGILYGPMRTEERNVELHDDPVAMEHVLAYCYGYDLKIDDMDLVLEVYKLADKYILDGLKKHCCKHIVDNMSKDNVKDVMEFAEKFNFTDFMKHNCIPYFRDMFDDIQEKYEKSNSFEDEPDYTVSSTILMDLDDDWIEELISEVCVGPVLDFHDSWKNPETPLLGNRLSTILTNKFWRIHKFYGCINAENLYQFPKESYHDLELCLSVTDPHHAKSVIEAINQQSRFEKHLIAIHIRCEDFWPSNWSPIPIERMYRPSILLISDADDDKIAWVVEAAKSFLPQSDGFYNKMFRYDGRYDDEGYRKTEGLTPINILKLPRSRFTPNGFNTLLLRLFNSRMAHTKILFQSPYINSNAEEMYIHQYHLTVQCLPMDHNFFIKVFEDFPSVDN